MLKKYQNLYNTIVRAAKKLHFNKLFKKYQSNLKLTWQLIHEVISKKTKCNDTISHILVNKKLISHPEEIANCFNDFFTSIAENIANEIIPTDRPPDTHQNLPTTTQFSFTDNPVTPSEVFDSLKNLQNKKSTDANELSIFFISKFNLIIHKPLWHIIKLSLEQGIVPQQFKISKVIPIFKSGQKTSMDNYRPISLLNVFSKILEKIVCNRLTTYLETNNLISKHQFGFRKDHSTIHPLMEFTNTVSEALNKKHHAIAIFCDLKKAFDTVDHKILLEKLKKMGVKGNELLWFQDYLTNRKQYVFISDSNSFIKRIRIGVPQGSILGPILFLIYINDLPLCTNLKTSLFADDTKLLASGPNLKELFDFVNTELYKVNYFFRSHKLSLHPSKTKYILFSNSPSAHQTDYNVFICNSNNFDQHSTDSFPIERINSNSEIPAIKFLGIFIDQKLDFKFHINSLVTKLSKAMYFLRNSKLFLSQSALKSVYYSLIHSHLVYANPIWSTASQSCIQKIFLKQKTAIRIITSSSYNSHTEPLFKELRILPLPQLIEFFRIQLMHRYKSGMLPVIFENQWLTNSERLMNLNTHNLRNADNFYEPPCRLKSFEKFPFYTLPGCWNALDDHNIKIFRDKTEFNLKLKEYFVNQLQSIFICVRLLCPRCRL